MIPASIRNNNPGAQYPGKSSKKFGSTTFETLKSRDGVHKIATVPTDVHGAAAQFDLLNRDYCGVTLEKAITRWCGAFYSTTYLKVLKDRAGIEADTVLTKGMLADHDVAIPLAKAMAWQEAGQDYPMTDAEWLEAHQMALESETEAPAWNPRNDVPTPKPETRAAFFWARVKALAVSVGSLGGLGAVWLEEPLIPAAPKMLKQSFVNLGTWSDSVPLDNWRTLAVGAGAAAVVAVAPWVKSKVMP
jgi:hypothetical protein